MVQNATCFEVELIKGFVCRFLDMLRAVDNRDDRRVATFGRHSVIIFQGIFDFLHVVHGVFGRIEQNLRNFTGMKADIFIRVLYKACINGSPLCFGIENFKVDSRIFERFPARIQIRVVK